MSMFTAFNISASGMTAQQLRTDVISENIANADTTRTSDGTPYVRKAVVFTEKTMTGTALGKSAYGSYGTGAYSTFSDALRLANGGVVGSGVKVTSVYEDTSTDIVIVRKGDKLAGLVVDNLIGQMEIVIKSLGKYININRMISGATILGDGSVALIIDANTLV